DASAASYPVPQDHRAFVGYDSEDGPVRGQSGQFASTLSAAEVANFYRAELAARGFLERPEPSPVLLAFAKGAERGSGALPPLSARTTPQSGTSLLRQTRAAAPP